MVMFIFGEELCFGMILLVMLVVICNKIGNISLLMMLLELSVFVKGGFYFWKCFLFSCNFGFSFLGFVVVIGGCGLGGLVGGLGVVNSVFCLVFMLFMLFVFSSDYGGFFF